MKDKQYFIVKSINTTAQQVEMFEEFVALMVAGADVTEIHVAEGAGSTSAYTLDVSEEDNLCWFLERAGVFGWIEVHHYNSVEDRAEGLKEQGLHIYSGEVAQMGMMTGLRKTGRLHRHFPKLTDVVDGGPFLFAVNKDSREEYNEYFDLYTCFFDGALKKLLVGKKRSERLQKDKDTVQYYYIHALQYDCSSKIELWRNMHFDKLEKGEWFVECNEYGIIPPQYVEELLMAVTDPEVVGYV